MKPFSCSEEQKRQMQAEQEEIQERMKMIKRSVLVLSGKGGVGKSTVAVNLAVALALAGKTVGLLDIDIHGPSVPKILNLENARVSADDEALIPVEMTENLRVISIGFLLSERDQAIIWRGPRKYQVIKQFLKDVAWGELDFLVIDSPPGTGDEPLAIAQLLDNERGAVIVTTPQEVALADVRKGVNFCRELQLPIFGVIENMSGFVCPKCGEITDIFNRGGAVRMAAEMSIPFLGAIPIDPQIVEACDSGQPYIQRYNNSQTASELRKIVDKLQGERD